MFFIVGETATCKRLAICRNEAEASKHIETLPNYLDGRYYIDACTETVVLDHPFVPETERVSLIPPEQV